jgi:hypothetical protein
MDVDGGGGLDRMAVHAALDAVLDAGAGAGDGGGEGLADALVGATRLRAVVDGALVGVLAQFEVSMAWAGDGHRSPVSWMVANLGCARVAAASERRVALAASRMPHVGAAAGVLGGAKLRLLVDARRAPVQAVFDRDEPVLVAQAAELGVDALRVALDRWYYDALAELGANEPDRDPGGSDRNLVRLRPGFAGRGLLEGDLCPEGRGTLEAAISAEIERWRREGSLDADPRTWNELQGDALVALVARGAARPDGEPVRPLVIAVADIDTLLARSGLDPVERTARRAEILGVGPVSDATVRELASRAGVALLVTKPTGEALWLGRSQRLATAAQRHAVLATNDTGCYWPGCAAPSHRCQIDHLTGWQQGGTTDIANLAPICGYHNRLKHRTGYQATRTPNGTITIHHPDGTAVPTAVRR